MAETMTRRTFLKGAAAAAVAVSLAGCGGGSTVGEFRVYFNGNPEFGWMISGDYGFVKLNIGIKGVENGITFSKKYSDVFSAEVNGQKLELQNGSTGILWRVPRRIASWNSELLIKRPSMHLQVVHRRWI